MNRKAKAIRKRLKLTLRQEKDMVQAIKNKAETEETSVFNVAYYVYFVCCMSMYPTNYEQIMKNLAV